MLQNETDYMESVKLTAECHNLTYIDSSWYVASVLETDDSGQTIFWFDVMKEKYRQLLTQSD